MSVLNDIFGSKPSVPKMPTLNLGQEQKTSISNNASALPSAEKLAGDTNLFSQEQITQMLKSVMPNLGSMEASASANIGDELSGKIPTDVSQAVQTSDAASALAGGYGGTGMGRNLVARDLGLTSLNLTQQGLTSAESWMKTADSLYAPSEMNLSSMFVSPTQQASFDETQTENQFNRNWLSSQVNAMPDPVMSGIHQSITSMGKTALTSWSSMQNGGGSGDGDGGGGGM
jgi:hypothetical protein